MNVLFPKPHQETQEFYFQVRGEISSGIYGTSERNI